MRASFGALGMVNLPIYWEDKWLPSPTTYTIQSPITMLAEDATVRERIDPDTAGWNISLTQEIFWQNEADMIFQLPLSIYRN